MAKKATPKKKPAAVNKSAMIRAILLKDPDAKPRHIAKQLSTPTVKVDAQYVSTIKSKFLGKAKPKPKTRVAGGDIPVDHLFAVKEFAANVGGVERARKILDALESLQA